MTDDATRNASDAASHDDLLSAGEDAQAAPAAPASGEELLDRLVESAHAGIDRLAETATPHVQRLQAEVDAASDAVLGRVEDAQDTAHELTESLRSVVREHPLAALAAAAALGMLIARLAR